ncbi:MAG: class I SAM-dependent methyltransferase [Candidatus Magasanikiibacteriota bacterium]
MDSMDLKKHDRVDSYQIELELAFSVWYQGVKTGRKDFGVGWLKKNGFNNLAVWCEENSEQFVEWKVLRELKEAFLVWHSLPEAGRGNFNATWLQQNGFSRVDKGLRKLDGVEVVQKSDSAELRKAYTVDKVDWTEESAVKKMDEMYEVFLKEKDNKFDKKGKPIRFNRYWLKSKGLPSLVRWANTQPGGLEVLNTKCRNKEVANLFERSRTEWNETLAVADLEVAYKEWLDEPADTRGNFNQKRIQRKHSGLTSWVWDNGGIDKYVALSKNDSLRAAFSKDRIFWDDKRVLAELDKAFEKWKSVVEVDGRTGKQRKFSAFWIRDNYNQGLSRWISMHSGLNHCVALSTNQELRKYLNLDNQVVTTVTVEGLVDKPEEVEEKTNEPGEIHVGVFPSEMIDLSGIGSNLLPQIRVASLQEREDRGSTDVDLSQMTADPNPLQKLRFDMATARQSGVWDDELIKRYIELHSYLPDFIFHGLSVEHIVELATAGKIKTPKAVLSVGGGAYGELIAWQRKLKAEAPMVFNLDSSALMLEMAKPVLSEKYSIQQNDFNGVVGDMRNFKGDYLSNFKQGDFDLIECSALDNLTEAQLPKFVEEIVDVLQNGQMVQLIARKPIPNAVWHILETMGCVILTPPNAKLDADLSGVVGGDVKKRIKQKLRDGGGFYLLAQKFEKTINPDDNKKRFLDQLSQAQDMETGDLGLLLLDLAKLYPNYGDIPEEELARVGFRREIIKVNKKGASNIVRIVKV